jgi:predicted GNAT family acetyltransferase
MDIDDIAVEREETGSRGRYVIRLPDGSEAELTYRRRDPTTLVADHTGTPPQYRGHGLALRLVLKAIEDARNEGFRIVPVCSYVEAQFRRHPDWADLRAE